MLCWIQSSPLVSLYIQSLKKLARALNQLPRFLPVALASSLIFALVPAAPAQTITALHHFSTAAGFTYTNSDGAYPNAGLILSANTLFGTTSGGGTSGRGAIFRVNIDGTAFTNLHSFQMTFGDLSTNRDGSSPTGRLLLLGNTLFGVTELGGFFGNGTVFRVRHRLHNTA
jgi:uncharacterized repeat protein (TIGR03803 family)